jgi:plastocyanin domain-containing protein
MTGSEWLVALGSLAAIAAVSWWFFAAGGRAAPATASGTGLQHATIVVKGGYDPARIAVRAGRPIRLVFDRQESSGCSEEIVFPAFGLRRFLPPFEQTTIDIAPQKPGRYDFTCGMSMLRGRLDVE